jgi:hypothetical protein
MYTNVLPNTLLRDELMPRTPQKITAWKDRLNGWAQVLTVIATMCAIGIPLLGYMRESEHRLTAIEISSATLASASQQAVKSSTQAVENSTLALRVALFQLEVMNDVPMSKPNRKRRDDFITEINRRKISENSMSDHATDTGPSVQR